MEDHDKSYGLIQVENLLLRSKLESHEATFRQLQNELKTVQEEVLSHSSDSGASIPENVELSKHLQTIEKLEQELQEMKDLDAKVKAKYLEDLDQLRVENLLLTQKLSSMQDSYEEMKFTVVKEKSEMESLRQKKRIDSVRIDTMASIISELDDTVKDQKATIGENQKTISCLKKRQVDQDLEMESVQEDLELVQVRNLVLNSQLVSHQEQQNAELGKLQNELTNVSFENPDSFVGRKLKLNFYTFRCEKF